MAFNHTQGDLPGDEIEERIDHEKAELCEHGVLPSLMGGRLCCKKCFDTLLTERDALRKALVLQIPRHARSCPAMFDGGCSCGAQEALEAKSAALTATEPAPPIYHKDWKDGIEDGQGWGQSK